MSGHAGGSVLFGSEGDDTLTGLGGTDFLDGGAGDDTLNGGGGTDTASYAVDLNTGVVVSLSISDPQNTGGAGIDTLTGIENLTGSNFNDYLTGDGGNNGLIGGFGDDYLYGTAATTTCRATSATMPSMAATATTPSTPATGAAANYVEASYGNDTVTGGTRQRPHLRRRRQRHARPAATATTRSPAITASTALFGGAGIDLLYVDSTDVTVSGGADADYLVVADASTGVNISASDIENWFGYDNGDTFNATGAATLIYMRGAGGADTLTGGSVRRLALRRRRQRHRQRRRRQRRAVRRQRRRPAVRRQRHRPALCRSLRHQLPGRRGTDYLVVQDTVGRHLQHRHCTASSTPTASPATTPSTPPAPACKSSCTAATATTR